MPKTISALVAVLMSATALLAGDEPPFVGYEDTNRDGINDHFVDTDGDGISDVTGKPYMHDFTFVDADGDGHNDHFVDADGDGVNDLDGRFVDEDGNGVCDNVIDADGDGINDITGLPYEGQLDGWRFGHIDEDRGLHVVDFIDRDGDGTHDAWWHAPRHGDFDMFIDEDGDGIADGRSVMGRHGSEVQLERLPRHGHTGADEDGGSGHRGGMRGRGK